jgi:hypothetical protein
MMTKQSISGELGAFGGGMGLRVLYVQCALPVQDVRRITLAEELPGSEEWPVRDLFQRDVDYDRVGKGIVPWLADPTKVKFFAPITLAILPFDATTERLELEIPAIDSKPGLISAGKMFELSGDALPSNFSGRATLTWDSQRCHLVALDGQHRVAALRAVADRGGAAAAAIAGWSIPAVVMCVVRETPLQAGRKVSFLDVARSVFVYINTQARTPSRARQILLNDESPSAIIAQEFIQYSHEAEIEDLGRFPICAIGWRDGTDARLGDRHKLLQLTEVHDLVEQLLLGKGGTKERAAAVGAIAAGDVGGRRLEELLIKIVLNTDEAQELREVIKVNLLPAINSLFVGLRPFREHAERVRVIERRLLQSGSAGAEALQAINIGGAGNWRTRAEVAQHVVAAVAGMSTSAEQLPDIFRQDIGMRGVFSGFAHVLGHLRVGLGSRMSLSAHVERYVTALNEQMKTGWLTGNHERQVKHLRHVTKSDSGTVKNYRFEDIPDALGALCAAIAASRITDRESPLLRAFLRDLLRKKLFETVRGGYVGELKRQLKDRNPDLSAGDLKDQAQSGSRVRAGRHIDGIVEDLGFEVRNV